VNKSLESSNLDSGANGDLGNGHQKNSLRITEIFLSLQGESRTVGFPTIFIRLTGCPLRCQYCDTAYAFTGGEWKSLSTILEEVELYGVKYVTVTGGEPLAQKNCLSLLKLLCDAGYEVSLETSGAMPVGGVDDRVVKVVDIKTPASGEAEKNLIDNFSSIVANDQIKFVICNEQDYEWAKRFIEGHELSEKCEILMSPSYTQLQATQLADWIVRDRLSVRFQLQLHKILWGDEPGR
jgi:7-carboxy-7-deazaguanine synthase